MRKLAASSSSSSSSSSGAAMTTEGESGLMDFAEEMKLDIRRRREQQETSASKKDNEKEGTSSSSSSSSSSSTQDRIDEEMAKLRQFSKSREEKRAKLKREQAKRGSKRELPKEETELLSQVQLAREKYKNRKKNQGNRQRDILSKLNAFKSTVSSAVKETVQKGEDDSEPVDDDAMEEDGVSWIGHKLEFENRDVVDPTQSTEDEYVVYDPLSGTTTARISKKQIIERRLKHKRVENPQIAKKF
eukprot:TRINITY_DN3624_c0_g1_i1.p1 TRINITY_DN3624_c0_g1~~TRINITY_DN3624_c0_g1_i1.p1  ORF type:complete len:245 (-),score=129.15 TRINITY_DN3624_c0_g1_i1:40-774(-)